MVNRYELRSLADDGTEGPLIALAQQKRMAFKEQVTFYADEERTQPVFGFKARKRLDLGATYDVTDVDGNVIGEFRKDFGKSLLRSTWRMSTPDGLTAGPGAQSGCRDRPPGHREDRRDPDPAAVPLRLHDAGRRDRTQLGAPPIPARPL